MDALPRGLCVPMPVALDSQGHFDAPSAERLLARLSAAGVKAALSAPGVEGLNPELTRQANESGHFSSAGQSHLAGVSAPDVQSLLENIGHALSLGAGACVLNPLAVLDAPDPVQLFHRKVMPLFEARGKSLAILLEDSGGEKRLRTRDLKQLARLDAVRGVFVTAGPKVVGNYLKAARHFKARHEFGVYLGNAELAFSLFRPASSALGSIREQWNKMWMGGEQPHGVAPLSACLFPAAWKAAWEAALAGDLERMTQFERAFKELGAVDMARARAALREEGVFSSDRGPNSLKSLGDGERQAWLFEYFSTKKELSKLVGSAAAAVVAPARRPASAALSGADYFDIAGIGGVVLDEFRRVPAIQGAESKTRVLGALDRKPGGVMLNQLSWASALGIKTALFGLLGADAEGDWLKRQAGLRGVDSSWLKAGSGPSEMARIFVDNAGEREIYLEAGAACATRPADMSQFEALIAASKLVSTEISILPLDAVLAVIDMARRLGKPVAVDIDIPPSQAARTLGTKAQMSQILKRADYLKASAGFAKELGKNAQAIHKKFGKKKGCWVALTDGARGSQLSDGGTTIKVAAVKGVKASDSTGCGDAYMAGLLAGTLLKLPLKAMGALAAASGAACAQSLGAAAPEHGARKLILRHSKGLKLELPPEPRIAAEIQGGDGADFMRVAVAELGRFAARVAPDALAAARKLVREAEAQGRRLHVTGVGKPEYVAGYIASSYSSTGTPAFFLHATEAGHGASGQVAPGDVVIAISNSGETEEMKGAVATVRKNGAKVIGVSGKPQSWLARHSDAFLFAGVDREGDLLNMAPRASVLAELMVLSALGVELQHEKKFSADDFRSFHPGGSLGKRA